MPAPAALQKLLEEDEELLNIGVEAVMATNSVDTPKEHMFIIVRWGQANVAFKATGSDSAQIWVHDKERDYGRINLALERLKKLLPEQVHLVGEDGFTLTTAEWLGCGPDLFDGGYQTLTRYADFRTVSRYDQPV